MIGGRLNQIIDQVSKEKSIDRTVLEEALSQSILSAAKKTFGAERELEAQYNRDSGEIELMMYLRAGVTESTTKATPATKTAVKACW